MKTKSLLAATAASVAVASAQALAAPAYSIRPLGTPGADFDIYVRAVNDSGVVVGYTMEDDLFTTHAVMFDADGAEHYLQDFTDTRFSAAYDVSNSGQIVGWSQGSNGFRSAAIWAAGTPDSVAALPTLPTGNYSYATSIDEHGNVVGASRLKIPGNTQQTQHAAVWNLAAGTVADYGSFLPANKNQFALFNSISPNTGIIGGQSYYLLDNEHAAVAHLGQPTSIADVSDVFSEPSEVLAVNDAGTMVGYSLLLPAIFKGDGTVTYLDTLGFQEGRAEAVSADGTIVGGLFSIDPDTGEQTYGAFIYKDGVETNLLDLLGRDSGWTMLFDAADINDNGQIVGQGLYNGQVRAFIITPTASVPEADSIAVATAASGALLLRRRRRA